MMKRATTCVIIAALIAITTKPGKRTDGQKDEATGVIDLHKATQTDA